MCVCVCPLSNILGTTVAPSAAALLAETEVFESRGAEHERSSFEAELLARAPEQAEHGTTTSDMEPESEEPWNLGRRLSRQSEHVTLLPTRLQFKERPSSHSHAMMSHAMRRYVLQRCRWRWLSLSLCDEFLCLAAFLCKPFKRGIKASIPVAHVTTVLLETGLLREVVAVTHSWRGVHNVPARPSRHND